MRPVDYGLLKKLGLRSPTSGKHSDLGEVVIEESRIQVSSLADGRFEFRVHVGATGEDYRVTIGTALNFTQAWSVVTKIADNTVLVQAQ